MALLRCDFFSEVLEVGTSMTVLLPQPGEAQIGVPAGATGPERDGFPVLYLLHGLSDDGTAWQRFTSVERYAAGAGLAVVMPAVGRSFYADERRGGSYWTFLSEELPEVVGRFFRVSAAREDTFVAGLSMGGYGALKWALRDPSRFGAAASLSGALDLAAPRGEDDWRRPLLERIFAGPVGAADDLFALLAAADPSTLPPLYVGCGTEDELVDQSRRFVAAAVAAGVGVTEDFGPGEHEWGLWDRAVRDVVDWLPLGLRGR
ncbi:MAG: alpha/beta hydrolase family protein [Nocardioidaceae bacterium]